MDANTQRNVARNLKLLRNARGLTQEQLSEELHICRTTYILYEQGKKLPSADLLLDLARYYQIRLDAIFDERTGSYVEQVFSDERCKRDVDHLTEAYYQLSPLGQGKLLERADALLEEEGDRLKKI